MVFIGKVAELTGASRRAIRLYEEKGLIPPPQRQGNYRVYSDTEVMAVTLIRQAQEVGFSLAELKEVVSLKVRDNRFPLSAVNCMIEKKRNQLKLEMTRLRMTRRKLDALQVEVNSRYADNVEPTT